MIFFGEKLALFSLHRSIFKNNSALAFEVAWGSKPNIVATIWAVSLTVTVRTSVFLRGYELLVPIVVLANVGGNDLSSDQVS